MKRALIAIAIFSMIVLPAGALAANNSSSGQGQSNGNSTNNSSNSQSGSS